MILVALGPNYAMVSLNVKRCMLSTLKNQPITKPRIILGLVKITHQVNQKYSVISRAPLTSIPKVADSAAGENNASLSM